MKEKILWFRWVNEYKVFNVYRKTQLFSKNFKIRVNKFPRFISIVIKFNLIKEHILVDKNTDLKINYKIVRVVFNKIAENKNRLK